MEIELQEGDFNQIEKDEPINQIEKNQTDNKNGFFSNKNLKKNVLIVVSLVLIILFGIVLGLIPIFLPKTKTVVSSLNNYTTQITTEEIKLTSTSLIFTSQKTTETTSTSTTQSTVIVTSTESTLITTSITTISTTAALETTTKKIEITTIAETTTQTTENIQTTTKLETTTTLKPTTVAPIITTTLEITTKQTCIINQKIKSIVPSSYNYNSCPNNSFYESSNLTLQTIYNFNYPIQQLVFCEGAKFTISCPSYQTIHIYSTYYGIQQDTSTNYCIAGSVVHKVCYNMPTTLINQCENKTSCSFNVDVGPLNDPCIGSSNKQLLIQYQCLDIDKFSLIKTCFINSQKSICSAVSSPILEVTYCNTDVSFKLDCEVGRVIKIYCSFYGIDPNKRCAGMSYTGAPSSCFKTRTPSIIESICNNRRTCSIDLQTTFIDANLDCKGFKNMLLIQYECASTNTLTTTAQPIPTTVTTLPFCSINQKLNGTCQTDSKYEPKFLSNSTNTHFQYPINQILMCENTRMIITCPNDLYIYIYAAYFGIQKNTMSSICETTADETPAMCYIANAFNIIKTSCDLKNTCSVRAAIGTLGGADLCPDFKKQLLVQYQCVDKTTYSNSLSKCDSNNYIPFVCPMVNSSFVKEETWCQDSIMSIQCRPNERIEILCAFYGLHPSITKCSGIQLLTYKPVCYFESSFQVVNSTCAYKSNCEIRNFSDNFKDPCLDVDKALYVQWKCV